MVIVVSIAPEYAYVIGAGVLSSIVIHWLGSRVVRARKIYQVEYPAMYAELEEIAADPRKKIFNCIQRAHQNTLEQHSSFLLLLLSGGLRYPILSSCLGLIWCTGRIAYALGYSTGNPEKRMRGVFGYVGYFGLLGTTVGSALGLLGIA